MNHQVGYFFLLCEKFARGGVSLKCTFSSGKCFFFHKLNNGARAKFSHVAYVVTWVPRAYNKHTYRRGRRRNVITTAEVVNLLSIHLRNWSAIVTNPPSTRCCSSSLLYICIPSLCNARTRMLKRTIARRVT